MSQEHTNWSKKTYPLSVTTGPAFIFPILKTGLSHPIFCKSASRVGLDELPKAERVNDSVRNLLWKTFAHAKGATSIGTPCFQFVPRILESFLESATIMKVVAASASTFSRN